MIRFRDDDDLAASLAVSSASELDATTWPRLMMMTLSQVISTSDRMCVDSRMVCSWPSSRMSWPRRADLRRVEAGRRLVEDEHRRLGQQSVGQADALAIALGERADELPVHVGEPAAVEDVIDALALLRP